MAQQILKFSQHYDKLNNPRFTTIRYRPCPREIGSIQRCVVNEKMVFSAVLEKIESERIGNIPLDILKKDTSPIPLKSRQDFIELMRSFYKGQDIDETTKVQIFHLKKIGA